MEGTTIRSGLAARLLGDHKDHSSTATGTITAMAQSADVSSSSTPNLFPTTTAGRSDSIAGPGSANVYYLVFLGVLVIILLLAACLAFRAFRMRRRYRTATQLAIARGDPLPMQLRDDYWGLAGLPGFGNGSDNIGAGAVITGDRGGKKGKWERVPKLEEVETLGQADERRQELFEDITPVTLHSLLALPDKATLDGQAEHPQGESSAFASTYSSTNTSPRRRFHIPHLRRFAPPPSIYPEPSEQRTSKPSKIKEINREIQEGEDMRVAVVIQMPAREQGAKERQTLTSDEEEEEVAWESGMELGVWEGTVGR